MLRHGTQAAILAVLVACGSRPADDVPDASDTGAGDVETSTDTATDVDPDADTTEPCGDRPPFLCATDCFTDVVASPSCTDGAWACPPSFPQRVDACETNCPGEPQMCCAPNSGTDLRPQVCVLGGWSCIEGGPDYCLPSLCVESAPPCCFADARPTPAMCDEAGEWRCPVGSDAASCGRTVDLQGTWHEVGRIACDGGDLAPGEDPVAELVFSDGFSLTFASGMFETFRNYWGTYTYDPVTGWLEMYVDGGNTGTGYTDLEGSVIEVDDRVLFRDLWLGTSGDTPNPGMCGYVMERN